MTAIMRSFRTKLQLAFVALALAAIAATGWQASVGASAALQQATYDRLTAVRETRASELERYFANVQSQVTALVSDESTQTALEQFAAAWDTLPVVPPNGLSGYYKTAGAPSDWFPTDPRARSLQEAMIAANPHPHGAKDLLLDAPALGPYARIHSRFHPTFHRYKTAFGFYDLFLISAATSRVLYTDMKEIDLGQPLVTEPYRSSPLARAFREALTQPDGSIIIEDYAPYAPSGMAPAAFVAAAIRRAGHVEGVLAIQLSIDEVNNVMDGGRRWREQGLGASGQVYAVALDGTLRSDLREYIESPGAYLSSLKTAGLRPELVEKIRRDRTAVLAYPVNLTPTEQIVESGTQVGTNSRGIEVLRSRAPLRLANLPWEIVAEVELREAVAPVVALRARILTLGVAVALVFFLAAGWLGTSVTRPLRILAEGARRIGGGERGLRIHVHTNDEIEQLASDFNRMSEDLEKTTVSKREMEVLAGRLITAQEDERRRLARELHDDFTQRLAAAAISAGSLERLAAGTPQNLRQGLTNLKEEMAKVSGEVHALSRRLHPAILDDLGLEAAIEGECRAAFERDGLITSLQVRGTLMHLSRDAQLALYRITQEALRNIQRHASASEASLLLTESDGSVTLEIHDNGRGFDRKQPGWHAGLGLASMEERARLLGGQFSIDSNPTGTTIQVSLPCNNL